VHALILEQLVGVLLTWQQEVVDITTRGWVGVAVAGREMVI